MPIRQTARWLALLAVAYFLASLVSGVFLAEVALHPGRRVLEPRDENIARQLAVRSDARLEDVSIVAGDGVILRAWSISPQAGNGDSVILLHGVSDNRMGTISYAELLLAHGYGVVMPDSRAHGASGGALATYGLLERNDIQQWIGWVSANHHPRCVYGFGESMGAAQTLQALPSRPEFCAVAVESPFANFREVSYDRVGEFFHSHFWFGRIIMRPAVAIALRYVKRRYGFDLDRVSPENDVAESTIPVLLVHGALDRTVPVWHSRRIQSRNSRVVLWEVPHADHCGAFGTDPAQFAARILAWFHSPPTSDVK
jgi:alpha-beta hydrolase superfamily lysophospholipase